MKKKVFALVMALVMLVSIAPAVLAASYDDTEGHWAEDSIDRWTDYGVVDGVGGGNFNPGGKLTRAQAAKIISNIMQLTEKADISQYTDVPASAWYADDVAKCVKADILTGTSTTTMSPSDPCTREMMFVMIARALGVPEAATCNKTFADAGLLHNWSRGYINALVNMGAVSGTDETHLSPASDMLRGQTMAVLDRLVGEYVPDDGKVVIPEKGIVLILAPTVTLRGEATGYPIVIAGDAETVDMSGVTGTPTVIVKAPGAQIKGAPAGAVIVKE